MKWTVNVVQSHTIAVRTAFLPTLMH